MTKRVARFKRFSFVLYQDIQVKIDRIVQVANRLRETQFFDVELIDRITIKLETEWKKLYTAVERRSTMLDASVSFHRSSEKVYVGFLLDILC